MAATLTDELTRVSVADIEKWDEGPDGTLYVYGKCTTPEVDTDDQVVASEWSGPALKEFMSVAPTIRVQHNAQRDPAGSAVRVDVNRDGDGAHWLKAAVDEPVAQRLVKRGHLRAFSVGISRPVIERDVTGKARGGIIKGGKIVEVSLVDSPANRSCFLELAKADKTGACEFTGKLSADDDFLAKALEEDLLTKDAAPAVEKSVMTDTWSAPDPSTLDVPSYSVPGDLSVQFTPDDMMRLMQQKFVSRHYDELAVKAIAEAEAAVYKRDIDTATRRRLAADGKALPNLSYPIETAGDLGNAAHLARTGHGDVAAARRLIARRARELGVQNPLDESDSEKVTKTAAEEETSAPVGATAAVKAAGAKFALTPEDVDALPPGAHAALLTADKALDEMALKEAEPDVTKDPEPEPKDKPVKKAKKPKKMPPWLKGDDDGDSDSRGSDDKGDDDSSKSAAPETCKTFLDHTWIGTSSVAGPADVECSKCHTTPAQAAGVAGSHDMAPAPVGELMESPAPASAKGATPASASGAVGESMKPVPAHREPDGAAAEEFEADAGMSDGDSGKSAVPDLAPDPELAALMRFKTLGIDEDLGRLHDLTCPAYSPEMAARYHPYATLPGLIDSGTWQRKTLAAAAGPLEKAIEMAELWQAVHVLKNADQAALNDWRLEVHKAFRDANPGPGSFPTPGCVSPQRYRRPVLGDGRAANAGDYGPPNSSPQVAAGPANAASFDRPPLGSGHQSPSPSHMKGGGLEYPSDRGVPQRISYEVVERDKARRSLSMLHDHLNHMFPSACPMIEQDAYRQPESRAVPVPAGIGKAAAEPNAALTGPDAETERGRSLPERPQDAVVANKATPEDGDAFADADVYKAFKKMKKKLGKKVLSGKMTVDEARAKLGRQFTQKGTQEPAEAVQKATAPRELTPVGEDGYTIHSRPPQAPPVAASFDPEVIKAAVAEATAPLLERLEKQQGEFTTKLAEQQRVIDAIADQPDPSTAAFSGLAFQPQTIKSRRPAAVPDQAEYAARAQAMIRRNLQSTYETHSNPVVREKAAEALATFGVEAAP